MQSEEPLLDFSWDTSAVPRPRLQIILTALMAPMLTDQSLAVIDLISDIEELPRPTLSALTYLQELAYFNRMNSRGSDKNRMGVDIVMANSDVQQSVFLFLPYSIHVELFPDKPPYRRGHDTKIVVHDCGNSVALEITEKKWHELERTVLQTTGLELANELAAPDRNRGQ